ncbi:hypothetical protein KIH41_17425 [Litoribacter ruber]|uniref:RHS repeat domain-containing protein n=1 Tax=Litoribacter ruber TaxID=702568 RepID=UPI001BDAD86E|nr:RHS repeat-associated core domain-containing protein [Litoribacter ruber]MBT0813073.1 hypothetical protein [Litoribacter ruber]
MDYYYTLQGWLKGVNMPGEGDLGADGLNGLRTGKDAFAFTLGYHSNDFKPINPNAVTSDGRDQLWNRYDEQRGTSGLYNGNIAWMNTDLPGLEQDPMQAMVYNYDQLHRIVEARSLREYGANGYASRTSTPKAYDVDYTYDANGNLLTLQRRSEQATVQDDFEYSYYENSNKLRNIDGGTGNNYTYDEVGNLIADAEEGITGIEWTPYGKVKSVNKSDGTKLEFRYDAAGQRIEKKVGESVQRYIRDASGNPMGIYEADSLIEQSIYGSSRLGIQLASSQQGYRSLGGKRYELSNHLGNVLAVVTDNINFSADSTWASAFSISDYYPFGLAMEGRTYQDTTLYRYGFNGMERDDEWKGKGNTYTTEFRQYDARVGRWMSVDPMRYEREWVSPYNFVQNNPLIRIDPNGLLDEDITIKGSNNSSLTIKTDLIDLKFNSKIDFDGNHTIADISNIVIGYEYSVTGTGTSLVGGSMSITKSSAMLFGGDYAGYWYDFIGSEAQTIATTSAEATAGIGVSWFIGVNDDPRTLNPMGLAGNYIGGGGAVSVKALIGGASICGQYSQSQDRTWQFYSLGISGAIGPQIGFIKGGSGSAEAHVGATRLINNPIPTKDRTISDKISNWIIHPFLGF